MSRTGLCPARTMLLKNAPRSVGFYAERLMAAQGQPARVTRIFEASSIPMFMVDSERRYVDANRPARLTVRQTLDDLRRMRADDITPRGFWPVMQEAWRRLNTSGCAAGLYDLASPAGTRMQVVYWAIAEALPDLCLITFTPAGWPDAELLRDFELSGSAVADAVTPRELQILELCGEGLSGPDIAEQLVLSADGRKFCPVMRRARATRLGGR